MSVVVVVIVIVLLIFFWYFLVFFIYIAFTTLSRLLLPAPILYLKEMDLLAFKRAF